VSGGTPRAPARSARATPQPGAASSAGTGPSDRARAEPVPVPPIRPGAPGIVDRCAPASERRGDQLYGTAAPVTRWMLVEQPGPWGRDALRECMMAGDVSADLARRAAAARVRVVLIRRPGRTGEVPERRVGWADSRPGSEGLRWTTIRTDRDLLRLPVTAPAGEPTGERAYLVCAHGKRDACCAIRGRAVAAALAAARPDEVWECSHVGGDRFAANVVALPHGLYHGHVPPTHAAELVRAYESGRVVVTLLRGRSAYAAPVQAAQHHARLALDEDAVDALPPLTVQVVATADGTGGPTWQVRLAHRDGPVTVVVRAERSAPVRLTCSSGVAESVRVFRLVAIMLPGDG